MASVIDPAEGMRIGIPFRSQQTIELDTERFADYDYEFPDASRITLIEPAADMGDLDGYYGDAIAEITDCSTAPSGYQYLTLTIVQVDINGKLSLTRGKRQTRKQDDRWEIQSESAQPYRHEE